MDLVALRNFANYARTVRIETDDAPMPFAEVADQWQMADARAVASALAPLIVPDAPPAPIRRFWWTRPRGHGKTADAAMLLAWLLAFSPRRRRAVWVASDKEQGCEGLDAIATLCRHNSWLGSLLTIRNAKVENRHTNSVAYFTASDVSSAYGWKDADFWPAASSFGPRCIRRLPSEKTPLPWFAPTPATRGAGSSACATR